MLFFRGPPHNQSCFLLVEARAPAAFATRFPSVPSCKLQPQPWAPSTMSISAETWSALKEMPDAARVEVLNKLEALGIGSPGPSDEDALAAAMAEVQAAMPPVSAPKMDLMAQLASMTDQKDKMVSSSAETSQVLERQVVRQRRKSRDLEQDVFGMHLTDVIQLRKVFDEIDLDKSGTIETSEFREALIKAGKRPTEEQIRTVLNKYAKNVDAGLTFDEFQKVIADWEDVIAGIDRPTRRASRVESDAGAPTTA